MCSGGLERLAERFEGIPARLEWLAQKGSAVEVEQVERDERGRRLRGEAVDTTLSRVDALRERLPVEMLPTGMSLSNHDLAVEYATHRELPGELRDEFREVAGEWLGAATVEGHIPRVHIGDRTEPVPLGFVAQTRCVRHGSDGLGEHWCYRKTFRQVHPLTIAQ